MTRVIKQVFAESMKSQGYTVSRPKVSKLMRKEGFRIKIKRRFKVTTDSNHGYSISKNHLSRNFKPKGLNENLEK